MDLHPNIKNMQSAIQKREIDQAKISQFEKWMANPKKFKEEYREVADQTLQEAKSLLASGSGDSGYQQLRQQGQNNRHERHYMGKTAGRAPDKTSHADAAPAESIGSSFHNPYTFIPFPKNPPERQKPTPLTIDEIEPDRLTGVLSLKLQTLSPLLTVEVPENRTNNNASASKTLRIGKNPIVPASSIRGLLRNLTAIISGSALDYVDDELWLCQGRDTRLDDQRHTMKLYMAEIIKPGDRFHDGTVLAGPAKLVKTDTLRLNDRERPDFVKNKKELWIHDPEDQIASQSPRKDASHLWRVKVSGRKVNSQKGRQNEGCFRPDQAQEITLRKELWKDYTGRYRNAEKKELRRGDLVWLEVYDQETGLDGGRNVKSIQWARWGRTGVNFKEQLKLKLPHLLPDSIKNDGLVDITSDLFGSIPIPEGNQIPGYDSFAARIRPENLVFDADAKTFLNQMPPLNGPHPGCKAFYVTNDNYDLISLDDLPRGYKVYRTSLHKPGAEPWKYDVQPVFMGAAKAKPFNEGTTMTRTCELISQDSCGSLKIAFRALTKREFSLLLLVLSCDLRIGGGKPLGLGHCAVSEINAYDENGEKFLSYQPNRASLPDGYSDLPKDWISRADLYCKTQIPVEMMRYPRAMNGNQQGGMCWFGYFASPKKNTAQGLGTVWVQRGSQLHQRAGGKDQIRAQALPIFDPKNPASDLLFGYDLNGVDPVKRGQTNYYSDFNDTIPESSKKFDNFSPNRKTRQEERNKR